MFDDFLKGLAQNGPYALILAAVGWFFARYVWPEIKMSLVHQRERDSQFINRREQELLALTAQFETERQSWLKEREEWKKERDERHEEFIGLHREVVVLQRETLNAISGLKLVIQNFVDLPRPPFNG